MDEPIERYQKGNKVVEIWYDDSPESPREWDNMGRMIISKTAPLDPSSHRNVIAKSEQNRDGVTDMDYHDNDWNELKKSIIEENGDVIIIPVHMNDYGSSGIRVTTASDDDYSYGMAGFIYFPKKDLKKERISAEQARKNLETEIEEYNQWVNGDVYGYMVYELTKCGTCAHVEEKDEESVWGFYGMDAVESAIKEDLGIDLSKQMDWSKEASSPSTYTEVDPKGSPKFVETETKSPSKQLNLKGAKFPSQNPKGWHREPVNHALASKGIKVGKNREKR